MNLRIYIGDAKTMSAKSKGSHGIYKLRTRSILLKRTQPHVSTQKYALIAVAACTTPKVVATYTYTANCHLSGLISVLYYGEHVSGTRSFLL